MTRLVEDKVRKSPEARSEKACGKVSGRQGQGKACGNVSGT